MSIVKNADETHFANVDLDIHSRSSLEPLVAAMSDKVMVLYVGRVKRHYEAHLELHRITQTADATIRGFCSIIRQLPKAQRKLWDNATIREFNVGIRAQMRPFTFEITIAEGTVREASQVNARIGVTVYAPEQKKP
jgi:hypothetical protein